MSSLTPEQVASAIRMSQEKLNDNLKWRMDEAERQRQRAIVPPVEPFLDINEVAAILHVCKHTAYKMVRDKTIPGFRIGAQWRFRRADILAMAKGESKC